MGDRSEAFKYFIESPYQFQYKEGVNPAEFVVSVCGCFIPSSHGNVVTSKELKNYFQSTRKIDSFLIEEEILLSNENEKK